MQISFFKCKSWATILISFFNHQDATEALSEWVFQKYFIYHLNAPPADILTEIFDEHFWLVIYLTNYFDRHFFHRQFFDLFFDGHFFDELFFDEHFHCLEVERVLIIIVFRRLYWRFWESNSKSTGSRCERWRRALGTSQNFGSTRMTPGPSGSSSFTTSPKFAFPARCWKRTRCEMGLTISPLLKLNKTTLTVELDGFK